MSCCRCCHGNTDSSIFNGGCCLLGLIQRFPHQDVFLNGSVENPGLLGNVGKRPVGPEGALQEVHLEEARTIGWSFLIHPKTGGEGEPTCSRMLEIRDVFPLPTFPQTPSRFPFGKQQRDGNETPPQPPSSSAEGSAPSAVGRRRFSGLAKWIPSVQENTTQTGCWVWSRTALRFPPRWLVYCPSCAAGTLPDSGSAVFSVSHTHARARARRSHICTYLCETFSARAHEASLCLQTSDGNGSLGHRLHSLGQKRQTEPHGIEDGNGSESLAIEQI